MCWEVIACERYNFKLRSPERGQVWETIAAALNSLQQQRFKVTARGVGDRYAVLTSKQKKIARGRESVWNRSARSNRIRCLVRRDPREGKIAKEKSDAQTDEKKVKAEKEKCAAEEVKQNALKSMVAKKKSA